MFGIFSFDGDEMIFEKKEFYQKRSTLRKRAKAAARKRYLKKLSREQMVQGGASPLARRPLRPVRKPAPFGATRPAYGARDETQDAVPYGRWKTAPVFERWLSVPEGVP